MSFFIEVINNFYKDEKNMAEFQEWKEAKASKGKDIGNEHICRIQQKC